MESGQVAEGRYWKELAPTYVPGRLSLPVASGGAATFALLAYQKYARNRSVALIQSNTMRALYTVPKLLDMEPRVIDSTYEDFLAMSADHLERALADEALRRSGVVVYSVIGGYLAPSFARVAEACRRAGVPLIVDGAHAHYLDAIPREPDVDIAYSFYATKILPAGEGGLVTTASQETHDWVRRFLIYDRFTNVLPAAMNLRAGELTGALIHRLMTDTSAVAHFKDKRVEVANRLIAACKRDGVRYLDPAAAADYNGYKLVVLDPREEVARKSPALTAHEPTSAVFGTDVLGRPTSLPHWCPPTYACLHAET
jgi:dTDP-4-amino-4,6-dideoxygalactose transaminase